MRTRIRPTSLHQTGTRATTRLLRQPADVDLHRLSRFGRDPVCSRP